MRANEKKPENPVKQVAGEVGTLAADKFPVINEEEQQIIPPFEKVENEEQTEGAFEIVPGMSAEEMRALFFSDALIEPPYKVWQLNSKGYRYYYRYDDAGNPQFFPSVTTVISQALPKSPYLIKWMLEKGAEESERYMNERAAYGTFMHAQFAELIIARSYNLDELKPKLKAYIEKENLPDSFLYNIDELKKDILAFAQFVIDYDVRPLAVEIALVHPDYGYAGCIDLPCNMQAKPGSEERFNAIIDHKSGKNGFYEEYEIQLHLYKMMWNANFPDCQITRVFNFAPKDWRKKPTYTLKDQTDSTSAEMIPDILHMASVKDAKRNNVFTYVSGEINLDAADSLEGNVVSLTLSELVKARALKHKKQPGTEVSVTAEDLQGGTENVESVQKEPENVQKQPEIEQRTQAEQFAEAINSKHLYSLYDANEEAQQMCYEAERIERGLNIDQHRWYSKATDVYKLKDGYVKVEGAYQSFSEAQDWTDINVICEAEVMTENEVKACELRKAASELEKAPAAKKTTAKKTTAKKPAKKAAVKPAVAKTTAKRAVTPKKVEKPAEAPKRAESEAKNNLLNSDIDI